MPFNFDSPEICNALKRYPDLKHFLEALEGLVEGDVWIARAPGRMDVMGGISDYSGGLVLQLPIDRACYAAVQILSDSDQIHITSLRQNHVQTE